MKRIVIAVAFVLLSATMAFSAPNISGVWASVQDDPNVSELIFTISQVGNEVVATTFFKFRGEACVWGGTGTIEGNRLIVTVKYGKRYHDWPKETDGRLELTISPDGKNLSGNWFNELGATGAVKYRMVK